MVLREAVYNAVRHGHPDRVRIAVHFEKNECEVRITDDGVGFDPESLPSLHVGHYGLVGMQERVQRVGGRFVVNSRTGIGTEVVLYVPNKTSVSRDEDNDVRAVL